jgi:hypothetical protein
LAYRGRHFADGRQCTIIGDLPYFKKNPLSTLAEVMQIQYNSVTRKVGKPLAQTAKMMKSAPFSADDASLATAAAAAVVGDSACLAKPAVQCGGEINAILIRLNREIRRGRPPETLPTGSVVRHAAAEAQEWISRGWAEEIDVDAGY